MLRNTKSQLLRDGDKPQAMPSHVKYTYPTLSKKKEDGRSFENFMEMIAKLQVNMSFVEALDQISVYAKFTT